MKKKDSDKQQQKQNKQVDHKPQSKVRIIDHKANPSQKKLIIKRHVCFDFPVFSFILIPILPSLFPVWQSQAVMWSQHWSQQNEAEHRRDQKVGAICDLICFLVKQRAKIPRRRRRKEWNYKTKVETNGKQTPKKRNETSQVTKQEWMLKLQRRKEVRKTTRHQTPPKRQDMKNNKNLVFPWFLSGTLHWKPSWSSTEIFSLEGLTLRSTYVSTTVIFWNIADRHKKQTRSKENK